ncbi:unnamed protein product, partial [Iphiclides podalirius]
MQLENAPENPKIKHGWTDSRTCRGETPATTCLMRKMGVLNKYEFMDYFKAKERLRQFCQGPWHPMRPFYTAAYSSTPLYRDQCGSPQKLLNVLDTMLATCPASKRRQGAYCSRMFAELTQTLPGYEKISNSTLEGLLSRYQHVFLPGHVPHLDRHPQRTEDNPRYRFNFGIFDATNEPAVRVIDVKQSPSPTSEKPLVLTPVYQSLRRPIPKEMWRSFPKK